MSVDLYEEQGGTIISTSKERHMYLDVIRIFAIFLVLFTHTGYYGNKLYEIRTGAPQLFYAYADCFRTINNHLLFMVSGVLLLGKEEGLASLWRKRILRLIAVLFVFSFVQYIWNFYRAGSFEGFSVLTFIKTLLEQPVRSTYWYLYSYISFLVMLPFMRKIAKGITDKLFIYLIAAVVIVLDIFPLLSLVLGISKINFSIFLSSFSTLSPMLGYALANSEKRNIHSVFLVGLSIACPLIAAIMTIRNYRITGAWDERWITLFYTITALCVFEIIKRVAEYWESRSKHKEIVCKVLTFISGTTFGIYLLENILEKITFPLLETLTETLPKFIGCIFWIVITMMLGNIIIGIFKKIPVITKLL